MKLEIRDERKTGKAGRTDAFVTFATAPEKGDSFSFIPAEVREAARSGAPAEAGSEGSVYTVPLGAEGPADRLYVFGIGKKTELSPRKARGVVRMALKALARNGETSAILDLPFVLKRMSPAESRDFLLRSALLADYTFGRYKTSKEDPAHKLPLKLVRINAATGPWAGVDRAQTEHEAKEAGAVAEVARLVRDIGNTPSNDMTPREFADQARKHGKARGLTVTVLDKKAIAKERMGGVLAVNQGSVEEPRFVVLEYHGGRKGDRPVALVGKGITFDSGGISIKPADRMGDMKWDMMGAATVVGVLLAAADLELPVNLVGLMPLTENMPSGSAYKPGDVVRFRNGKTAEIDNTDAEGRVVLADALDYAAEWKPEIILDYATLTGAAVVALGLEAAIVYSDHDDLVEDLISAGERTDERLWRLPMWDDYKENIRSDWADFKNTGGRWGGSINAAMFLKEFVDPKTPWAHLDIAPTAYFERDHAGYPVGATAFGISMTLRWLRDRADSGAAASVPAKASKKKGSSKGSSSAKTSS
ncbi:MAG: leucyl aminopeptidase [Thermoanaerobaculia bacterium]